MNNVMKLPCNLKNYLLRPVRLNVAAEIVELLDLTFHQLKLDIDVYQRHIVSLVEVHTTFILLPYGSIHASFNVNIDIVIKRMGGLRKPNFSRNQQTEFATGRCNFPIDKLNQYCTSTS
jgi:hypothetical protein